MITAGLKGVDFVVANTDAQALTLSKAERVIQMGVQATEGLGAGSQPDVGCAAAEEVIDEIRDHLSGAHMVFVTAGMGGGTGTGAAPVVARVSRELGILTVGVVTKPFHFEGQRRMRVAEAGIQELQKHVDTQLIIPNQNLFRVANERTTFADAFAMADQVLYSGVACITDLMVKEGLINLDFADVRAVMREMGKAMMGTGEAAGEKRALAAAEAAIANPLIDDSSMKGAKGLLISITGGRDLTLYEVDEAATRIREEVDQDANIIVGATFDEGLEGVIRVSVVATGIDQAAMPASAAPEARLAEVAQRMRSESERAAPRIERNQAAPQPRMPAQPAPQVRPAQPAPTPAASAPGRPAAVESAAHAAVAAAVLRSPTAIEDVTIRPIPPKPSLFPEPDAGEPIVQDQEASAAFIPPAPERVARAARMPRVDELPIPAQNEIRQQRGEYTAEHPEKRRLSLLQRLASVGLGRRDDEEEGEEVQQYDARPSLHVLPSADRAPQQPAGRGYDSQGYDTHGHHGQGPDSRHYDSHPADPVSEYAKRPAPQGLDPHGRSTPVNNQLDDDQLDIPAFLRRQAK